jgi:hypothetical protein
MKYFYEIRFIFMLNYSLGSYQEATSASHTRTTYIWEEGSLVAEIGNQAQDPYDGYEECDLNLD